MDVMNKMFSTEDNQAQGISAVKAIGIASAQGQKIWTITQDNLETALANINLGADTEAEIRNSVNTGKVVTTHEQRLNYNGWIGEGYIILDSETGAGAYKIAGGGNGGFVEAGSAIGNLGFLAAFAATKGLASMFFAALVISIAFHIIVLSLIIFDATGSDAKDSLGFAKNLVKSLISGPAAIFKGLDSIVTLLVEMAIGALWG